MLSVIMLNDGQCLFYCTLLRSEISTMIVGTFELDEFKVLSLLSNFAHI